MPKFLLIATLLAASGATAADSNLFSNLDIFEIEVAADPQISPDGTTVAYVRRAADIMTDRPLANIWSVDTRSGDHRPLLSGTDSYASPRWSPAGDRLAYVTHAAGRGSELHMRWQDTGQTALLSNLASAPSALAWSPDGQLIAFSAFVKTAGPTLADAPTPPKGAAWAPPVTVIDSLNYRFDGQGYLKPGYRQVFVIPAEGGSPRQLTEGPFNHGGPLSWTPDGESLILSSNRNADWEYDPRNTDLWQVSVASGEMTQLTTRAGPDESPVVSPDGSRIAYLGYDDKRLGYQNARVYVMTLEDRNVRSLTDALDRSVDAVQWAGNSRRLAIQYDSLGKTVLASLSLSGKVQSLVDNVSGTSISRPYTSGGFSVSRSGTIAYTAGSAYRPSDVAVVTAGGQAKQLTRLNEDLLAHKELGEVDEINWESSADGLSIQGWRVRPPGFSEEQTYPLILEIHGGPFAAYGPHFSAEAQLFAAAGYVVLYANPRGSTSYGSKFANEIHHNYPGQDYDDLISGVDTVVKLGNVDPQQLFVTGGSGGGVLTAWIVGKTDRFAAAVVAKPVINWTSMTLYSDIHTMIPRYWFAQLPWEDPESYWRRSPLSLVGNVSTPTMLLTGEADYRTPMAESEQYYQALKLRKVDSMLVRVPEASHGIAARPSHLIAKVDNILAWFKRYRVDSASP